jgi:threonine dehydratase
MLAAEDIAAAHELIGPHIRRTPVIGLDGAEVGLPAGPVTLKLEVLQHAGSFKARGAFHNLLRRPVPAAGVYAASGGNHGAAVAYAASRLGIPVTIFVPTISSPAKVARIRRYGADLVIVGDHYGAALAAAEDWGAGSGAMAVPAYDGDETVAGAGTLGRELEEQIGTPGSVLVAVGGGGLYGGVASWFGDRARVVGVEPESCPTLSRALAEGKPVDVEVAGLAADSLGARRVGERAFRTAEALGVAPVLVSDDDIRAGQAALWELLRVVAEPGGAAAFGALLAGRYRPAPGEHVAVAVSGGNTVAVDFALQERPR